MRLPNSGYLRLARLGLFALGPIGCNATYSPPIRATHYGAPGRLEQGRVEVGGTAGGIYYPDIGGPRVAIGLRDWVSLEVGGNFSSYSGPWALGSIGPRFSLVPHRESPFHLITDLEVGAGAGVGGVLAGNAPKSQDCPDCDGRQWNQRFAVGGYQGLGIGYQMRWFSLFARARLEESKATNVPTTLWPSAMAGMEFNIKRRASISLGGGYMGFANSKETENGWFYQLGVTLFFDAFSKKAVAQR